MKKRYYITFAAYAEIDNKLFNKLKDQGFSKISIASRNEATLKTPLFYAALNSDGLGHNEYCFVYNKLVDTCKKKQIPCIIELKEVVNSSKKVKGGDVKNVSLDDFTAMGPFNLKAVNPVLKKADIYVMVDIMGSTITDINKLSEMKMISFEESRTTLKGWDRVIFSLNFTKEDEALRYFNRFKDIVYVSDLSSKVVLSNVTQRFSQNLSTLPMVKA